MSARAAILGAAAVVALVALVWPLAAVVPVTMSPLPAEVAAVPMGSPTGPAWGASIAWTAGLAFAAMMLGWPAGRALAARPRSWAWMAVLAVALQPAYAIFAAWWTVLSPGNFIFDWAATNHASAWVRRGTLILGVVGWAWAPAALVVALLRAGPPPGAELLCRMDGPGWWTRLRLALWMDGWALLAAWGAAALAVWSDSVVFDLSQEPSIGFELRALESQGATPAQILKVGWPSVAVALAAAVLVAVGVARRARTVGTASWSGAAPLRALGLGSLWPALLALVPLGILSSRVLGGGHPDQALLLHARGSANTLAGAFAAGALACPLAAAAALAFALPGRARWFLLPVAAAAAVTAAVPSAVLASACHAAWLEGSARSLMQGWPALVLAEVSRFAAIALATGAVAGAAAAARIGACLRMDGPVPLSALRPWVAGAALAGGCVVAALAAGEVPLAARLEPPGFDWIASSLLNALHYQQPMTVSLAIVASAILAAIAAAVCVAALRRRPGGAGRVAARAVTFALCVLTLPTLPGCRHLEDEGTQPLPDARVVGAPGLGDGRFDTPRAAALDPVDGTLLVVDKTARVQRFSPDGRFLGSFQMPEWTQGKPVGITVGPDGTIFIPDTHYHRVIVYERDGRERLRFGEYGTGPGQFIYPTDVVLLPDGNLAVAEYGGNDRVQVFSPTGEFRRQFGHRGAEPGGFDRPQAMALSPDGRELFVADACNHRIQVLDPADGRVLRVLGHAGEAPGSFEYPYGISVLADGTLLVTEFGNERVQHLQPADGAPLHVLGGRGVEPGRLRRPWTAVASGGRMWVVDGGNNRVISAPLPWVAAR
ncbi:MAG: hypothetical protein U0574_06310 [Phycisphaerales bacterium]